MRYVFYFLAMLMVNGCIMNSAVTIKKGISEKRVLKLYGMPDVISERSGDLERRYVGRLIPEYAWPKSSVKKFYYLKKGEIIVIQYNRVILIESISEEDRKMTQRVIKSTEAGEGIKGIMKEN